MSIFKTVSVDGQFFRVKRVEKFIDEDGTPFCPRCRVYIVLATGVLTQYGFGGDDLYVTLCKCGVCGERWGLEHRASDGYIALLTSNDQKDESDV